MESGVVETSLLIIRLGLLCQLAIGVLLTGLFTLLYRTARRRMYFYYWAIAWSFLAASAVALVVHFFALDLAPGGQPMYKEAGRIADGFYLFFKLAYLVMLVLGTLNYVRGMRSGVRIYLALAIAAVYALLFSLQLSGLQDLLYWQLPAAVAAYGASAWVILRLPKRRRSLGSAITGSVFGLFVVVWACFSLAPIMPQEILPPEVNRALAHLLLYLPLVDVFVQMLLAFGMVLLLMEDARRETEAAHGELAAAHKDLLRESERDSLTGALNRRALAKGTGLQAARAEFGTVLVFDLDNLKQVNDRYGHRSGDRLLCYFVDVLRKELRASDKLYRIGGDEFLLVMPRAHRDDVLPRFRTFCNSAAPLRLAKERTNVSLNVSLGGAVYTGREHLAVAIAKADREMYAHKRRNKLFQDE